MSLRGVLARVLGQPTFPDPMLLARTSRGRVQAGHQRLGRLHQPLRRPRGAHADRRLRLLLPLPLREL
eukprot:2847270-Alexandrium_andersonii.AAC.1